MAHNGRDSVGRRSRCRVIRWDANSHPILIRGYFVSGDFTMRHYELGKAVFIARRHTGEPGHCTVTSHQSDGYDLCCRKQGNSFVGDG